MLSQCYTSLMKPKKLGKTFSERVVEAALTIPPGRVTTYGRLARACGAGPMASQSITSILGKAYQSGETTIPFHRIVYANGTIWVSDEYREKRLKLYKKEGIEVDEKNRIKNFDDIVFDFH
jgi:methylated-DNA-protein-cysteine methyltransferase related protein